jgi:hypothetical protein
MLRIVPHTVPRVGRSYEHLPDGFKLRLLHPSILALRDCYVSGVWFLVSGFSNLVSCLLLIVSGLWFAVEGLWLRLQGSLFMFYGL